MLKSKADENIAEVSVGFRAEKTTTTRSLTSESYLQHKQSLYKVFIDFKKAVNRLWMCLYGLTCNSNL